MCLSIFIHCAIYLLTNLPAYLPTNQATFLSSTHTYIHTCILTYTYTHTHTQTHISTHKHTHIHTYMHALTPPYRYKVMYLNESSSLSKATDDLEKEMKRTKLLEQRSLALSQQRDREANEKDQLASKYHQERKKSRSLSLKVQDLRGNIRVLCRVRPTLESEFERKDAHESGVAVNVIGDNSVAVIRHSHHHHHHHHHRGGSNSNIGGSNVDRFKFDHVFGPNASQADVFDEIQPLIEGTLSGFNTTLFAYGQTGSGKTHTMQGPSDDRGVNHRALASLFQLAEEMKQAESWEFNFKISMLQVYNEVCSFILFFLCLSPFICGTSTLYYLFFFLSFAFL